MGNHELFLFDIDGTLLHLPSVGKDAFVRAVEGAFGVRVDFSKVSFAGATELLVLGRVFESNGLSLGDKQIQAQLPEFFRLQASILKEELKKIKHKGAYEGAWEVLKELSSRSDARLGLVTGNSEDTAHAKLNHSGLGDFFKVGAYGNEFADRSDIAKLALSRAQTRLNEGQAFKRVYLIGDTPSDISAAHSIGAVSIAMGLGTFTVEQLKESKAHFVFGSLNELLRHLMENRR